MGEGPFEDLGALAHGRLANPGAQPGPIVGDGFPRRIARIGSAIREVQGLTFSAFSTLREW